MDRRPLFIRLANVLVIVLIGMSKGRKRGLIFITRLIHFCGRLDVNRTTTIRRWLCVTAKLLVCNSFGVAFR